MIFGSAGGTHEQPMPLTGIHNENEFYSHHYLMEIFAGDIQGTLERWRKQAESAKARTPWAELRVLAPEYLRFRGDFNRERRPGQRIQRQREWFRTLLGTLGYGCQPANLPLEDGAEVPILCADGGSADTPRLLALGAFDATGEGEDPLSLKPHALQFHGEAPPPEAVLNETWETIATRRLFAQNHPPRWLLILSCSSVLLLERGKWTHKPAAAVRHGQHPLAQGRRHAESHRRASPPREPAFRQRIRHRANPSRQPRREQPQARLRRFREPKARAARVH